MYPQLLSNSQLLHLEHGGRVSVTSSNIRSFPHLLQTYFPFPGFSPHLFVNFSPQSNDILHHSFN